MKKSMFFFATAATLIVLSSASFAQQAMTSGVVTKVDKLQGTIRIHESRACSPQNFRFPVQKDFCNNIGTKRTGQLRSRMSAIEGKPDIARTSRKRRD